MHANFPPTSWLVSAGAARGRFGVLEGRLQLVHKLWRAYQAHRDFLAVEKLRACTYNLLRALTRSCAGRRPSAAPRSRLATRPGAMRARTVTSVGSPGVCQCPPHEPSFAQISLPAFVGLLSDVRCMAPPHSRARSMAFQHIQQGAGTDDCALTWLLPMRRFRANHSSSHGSGYLRMQAMNSGFKG